MAYVVLRPATGWDTWITRHVKRKALHDGSCKGVPSQRFPGRCSAAQTRDRTCGAGLSTMIRVSTRQEELLLLVLRAGRPISLHVGPGALTSAGGMGVDGLSSPHQSGHGTGRRPNHSSCDLCTVLPRAAAASLRPHAHAHTGCPDQTFYSQKRRVHGSRTTPTVCATEYFEPLMRVLCARFGCIDLRPYLILLLMDSYGDLKISNTRCPAQCTSSSANQRALE